MKKPDLAVTINAIDGAAAGVENVYINRKLFKILIKIYRVDLMQPSDQINYQ